MTMRQTTNYEKAVKVANFAAADIEKSATLVTRFWDTETGRIETSTITGKAYEIANALAVTAKVQFVSLSIDC